MDYKFKVGDRVTNSREGSAIVINGVISSVSTGEEVNKFQPCRPGAYYYIKSDTGWLIGAPEEDLKLAE